MSRSSAASKPSSAASKAFLAFEARAVPIMRRLGELPVRRRGARGAAVELHRPRGGIRRHPCSPAARRRARRAVPLGLRLASALLPAFGVMAAALVVVLPLRLAHGRALSAPPPLLAGSVAAFALALPRPFGPDPIGYLRFLGASGLFIAILACGSPVRGSRCLRRRLSPALPTGRRGAGHRHVCRAARAARLASRPRSRRRCSRSRALATRISR